MVATVSSETRMLPWTATPGAVRPPAQGMHCSPVKVADRPCMSTTPTWRWEAMASACVSRSITSTGATPCASSRRPSGPYERLANAWVATAPTPAWAQGTITPTARNLEATATPHSWASGSAAAIEKVAIGESLEGKSTFGIMRLPLPHVKEMPCPNSART